MFIYCYDKKLESELAAKGYKKMEYPKNTNYSVFFNTKKLSFDFSKFSNGEFEIVNALKF